MVGGRKQYSLAKVASIIQSRSIPEPNSGCLLWEGTLSSKPGKRVKQLYGSIRLRQKMVRVHRVAFEAAYGPIPEGKDVLHTCDVTICCNPNHLFLGTNADNIADKVAKDRGRKRLTHEKAVEIHALRQTGMRVGELARKFDLHPGFVSNLLSGKRRPRAALSATQE